MTDLERIELVCRSSADRELAKLSAARCGDRHSGETPEPVDLQMIKILEMLADELSTPCEECGGSGIREYYVGNGNVEELPCETCKGTG